MKKDRYNKKKIFNQLVLSKAEFFKPDIIYSVLSFDLERETLCKLKKNAKLVLFLSDSLELYPESENNLDLFDLVFSYEMRDVKALRRRGIKAFPQMGAYDEAQYFKIDNIERDIDVSLVGKMYNERKVILERLVNDLPDLKLKFYGEYAPKRKPLSYIKWLTSKKMQQAFANKNIHYTETNLIYNRSKIVLNINCLQSQSGWSSRLPEISCTGAFQIVDKNPEIEREFGDDLIMYSSYDDLLSKIRFYINNNGERERLALSTYKHVKDMTLTNNIKIVIEETEKI
jgi:spore maturation protein CgeB